MFNLLPEDARLGCKHSQPFNVLIDSVSNPVHSRFSGCQTKLKGVAVGQFLGMKV
jgi:hypothetical protein